MAIKRHPKLIEHLPRSLQIVIFTLVARLDSGKNALVAVVGQTGSGKSFAVVSLMYWIHVYMHGKHPTVEEISSHWFFRAKSFISKMNEEDLKKRSINLWDEMGFDASHKTHQSVRNKVINWLVQTFRNLEQLVFFTVPTVGFIDASVRKMLHYQFETRKILKTDKLCIIKPLEIQYNLRQDKMYYHNLMWPSEDGSGFMDEVDVIGVPLAPKEFIEEYERLSWQFKRELNLQLEQMLEAHDEKERKENLTGDEAALLKCTPTQIKMWELLQQGITDQRELSRLIGLNQSTISRNFVSLRKKGLDIDLLLRKGKDMHKTPEKIASTI